MGPWANADPNEVESSNLRVRVVERRLSFFLETHPGFEVARPWETESGQWEVTTPADGVLPFDQDQPVYMMNTLEERYTVSVPPVTNAAALRLSLAGVRITRQSRS